MKSMPILYQKKTTLDRPLDKMVKLWYDYLSFFETTACVNRQGKYEHEKEVFVDL